MMIQNDIVRLHLRLLLIAVVVGAVAGGTALAFRAPLRAWAYSVTGEEGLAQQVKGVAYYLGNVLRAQPRVAADVTVQHADVIPFGINTFLQHEVEVAKRERSLLDEICREQVQRVVA